ncbi:MAG: hypothetical protein WBM86_19970 [Waterburya sp.]
MASLDKLLDSLTCDQCPTIDITSRAIGLSVRSLQRYLSQHNLTYSRLLEGL